MTDPSPARVAAERGRSERRAADETARRRAQEAAVTVEPAPPVPAPTPDGQTGTQGREEQARSGSEGVTLWRCSDCGKWSHALRRPKHHQRFVAASDDDDLEAPPAGLTVTSTEPPTWNGDPDEDGRPGGWWVACGPFDEYRAVSL